MGDIFCPFQWLCHCRHAAIFLSSTVCSYNRTLLRCIALSYRAVASISNKPHTKHIVMRNFQWDKIKSCTGKHRQAAQESKGKQTKAQETTEKHRSTGKCRKAAPFVLDSNQLLYRIQNLYSSLYSYFHSVLIWPLLKTSIRGLKFCFSLSTSSPDDNKKLASRFIGVYQGSSRDAKGISPAYERSSWVIGFAVARKGRIRRSAKPLFPSAEPGEESRIGETSGKWRLLPHRSSSNSAH